MASVQPLRVRIRGDIIDRSRVRLREFHLTETLMEGAGDDTLIGGVGGDDFVGRRWL